MLVCVSASAFAWGPTGHRVVGRIAENHLSPKARKSVQDLLGPVTLAEASTWADEIRSDPAWKHASSWHYINVEDGESIASAKRKRQGDILRALERFSEVLRDSHSSKSEKAEALKWLVHLAGDIHQPLHVGKLKDLGGNKVQVFWMPSKDRTNLHAVWDDLLIDSLRLSFSELTAFVDRATAREIATWQKSSFLEWAEESLQARGRAYEIDNGRVGYEYAHRHMQYVRVRLLQAGIRLAGLLNSTFK